MFTLALLVVQLIGCSTTGPADETLSFDAAFYTDLIGLMPDESCGDPPRLLNIQEGAGEDAHLGEFSVRIK